MTHIDQLATELRGIADAWDAPVSPPITVTLRAAADALESTAAELRQERERAEFYKREVDVADSTAKLARQRADKAEAELARAQAVIGKAREALAGVHCREDDHDDALTILATYEKGQQS